jgi:hypothetical protein
MDMKAFVRIPKHISILFLLLALFLSASCGRTPDLSILIVKNAYDRKLITGPDGSVQITYMVKAPYPDRTVYDFYESSLRKDGWLEEPQFGSDQNKWRMHLYTDRSKGMAAFDYLAAWTDPAHTRKAVLALGYREEYSKIDQLHQTPYSDAQTVVFTVSRLPVK